MHFDEIMTILGQFGRYQRIRFFMICMFCIVSAWHALNMVFIGAVPDFHCKITIFNLSGTSLQNLSSKELIQVFIPKGEKCKMYDVLNESFEKSQLIFNYSFLENSNSSRNMNSCTQGYEYSKKDYVETLSSEFDLVCGNKFWLSMSKSVFFAGRLFGALIFGQLSDCFGRRPMFFIGCLLLLIAGTVASFAPSMLVFMPAYFCQGAAHTGVFLVSYTLSTELVGPKYRVVAGFVSQVFYSIGYMSLAGIAYLVRDWRYLEIAITAPVVLFGIYWWFLPESVLWLFSHGKDLEAERILNNAAKQNGVTLNPEVIMSLKEEQLHRKTNKQYYLIDLVNTWKMARLSLNIWLNWLVNSLVYYGLSLNTSNLAGNPYLNFCIAGAVEIPAYIMCILTLNKVGRRWPLIFSMFIGGVACILSGCIPVDGDSGMETLSVVLAMVGKFGITASYAIIYLLAAELFPTVTRNIGMGVSSMSARIGGIIAPFILELQDISKALPLIVFGSLSLVAGSLAILLPETAGKPLPQLPEDVDHGRSCVDVLFCGKHKGKLKIESVELSNKPDVQSSSSINL